MTNPPAEPIIDIAANQGLWQYEDLLIVDLAHHRFPSQCVHTDKPVQAPHRLVTISTSLPPADELLVVLGTIVCSSQQPVREKVGGSGLEIPLRLPLIQEQEERPRYRSYAVPTAIVGAVIAAMAIATIIYQTMVGNSALMCPLLIGILAGATVLFGVSLLTYRVSHIPSPALLREGKLWLRGVNAEWLARLPEFRPSREFLLREKQAHEKVLPGGTFAIVVLLLISLFAVPFGIMFCIKGFGTVLWQPAPATIRSVSTQEYDEDPLSDTRQATDIIWNFDYSVRGREYRGTDRRHEGSWAIGSALNKDLKPGTPITVYYNPDDVAEVRVARGLNSSESATFAAVLTALGLLVLSLIYSGWEHSETAKWESRLARLGAPAAENTETENDAIADR